MGFGQRLRKLLGQASATADAGAAGKSAPPHAPPMTFDQVITREVLQIHFQPLVDVRNGDVFAYEGLSRSPVPFFNSPPALFDWAIDRNRVGELGRFLRQLCIEDCPDTPLFINIHPNEFDAPWLVRPDDPIYRHGEQVFLEITESVPLHYFSQCHGVLAEARSKGIRLAVDDLGAGYSNLKYISDLAPEIVKLDRQLVAGLHLEHNQRLRKLVRSIVRLCCDMGARVVAEGIEEPEELEAVMSTGVHYVQGYLLARPALPPPSVYWPDRDDVAAKIAESG